MRCSRFQEAAEMRNYKTFTGCSPLARTNATRWSGGQTMNEGTLRRVL
jgi:hypothetical protein